MQLFVMMDMKTACIDLYVYWVLKIFYADPSFAVFMFYIQTVNITP